MGQSGETSSDWGAPACSTPTIARVANPGPAIAGTAEPVLELMSPHRYQAPHRPPLIFIHGMEYRSPREAFHDLVKPFVMETGLMKQGAQDRDMIILFWDSCLIAGGLPMYPIDRFFKGAARLGWQALNWTMHMADLEQRAKAAAKTFAPALAPVFDREQGPLVISHSMGALLWSEIVSLAVRADQFNSPGQWWNMQPALAWDCFHPGGDYEHVAAAYDHAGRMKIWISRLDMVLSTLFLGAKKTFAMGQVGLANRSRRPRAFEVIDLTMVVGEAHGHTFLWRRAGHYFRRARRHLHQHAAELAQVYA